ncbi:mannitol dehydrogenase family protein [uncultured Tateyamaria sp.]|uniref:mannitol dehydrogenase family protein n=1 Tax=uncultured Tateyamaria sp. TaxID=455651 RepID=UPI002623ECA9|nr:mannitol dehydrogenase family protein [uncultured Tateyamaria sp.]
MADGSGKRPAVPLSDAVLATLPDSVMRPTYDRSTLHPGIVHIGVGNFHRGHQAWYLHRLMQAGLAHDWAIIGAGVRKGDALMREKLLAQDCLTTLVELDPSGTSAEIVGSMIGFLPVEQDNASLIATMSRDDIRIVALTVTEGGYYVDPKTGGLDLSHHDIQHDIAHPDTPVTAFGAIVAALSKRKAAGLGPFTSQSCDNLQGNGDILRKIVVSLAQATDPELARWIETHATFPNSMVDCIVPATGPDEIALAAQFGITDAAPVTHENFRQWVIEDAFCAGRPDWDKAGAIVTDQVHSYEAMKIRILNAGHQVLANAGELLGLPTIADCMTHATLRAFFRKVQMDEIVPYVAEVPGFTPAAYVDLIETRFANAAIRDTTRRVAFDGSSRHTGFVLPILRDAIDAQGSIAGLSLVEALWARMCEGTREDGSTIESNDPQWETLTIAAQKAKSDPRAWLTQNQYYQELADIPAFARQFETWLRLIWSDGVDAALCAYTTQSA